MTEFPSVVIVLFLHLGLRFSSGKTHTQKVDAKDVITENETKISNLSFLKKKSDFIHCHSTSTSFVKEFKFPQLAIDMSP